MYSRGNSGTNSNVVQRRSAVAPKGKRVQVWARIRPTACFAQESLELLPDGRSINVHSKRDTKSGNVNNQISDWSFRLDGIFHNSSQDEVFETVITNIVSGTLDGYNGTVLCYGQTGAGKTFTMTGATESYKHRGVIPRSLSQLFKEIEERPESAITVRISYLEIYNETMFDLLCTLPESWNPNEQEPESKMVVLENQDGVFVKGLSCHLVQSEEEALNLLFEGETNRAIATHTLNKHSSRSHCIFTAYIETRSRVQSDARYTVSKLNFVDLAGSERLGKTKSVGKTQMEAMYINKSLTFLEQVIVAMADPRREHVPFRQSKLTHYLKDSIGGNCNTLLVANIWGEATQLEETVSTLRFATRMMCVESRPAINAVYDPAVLVKKLEKEIIHLKNELAMHDTLTNRSRVTYDSLSEQQKFDIRQQVRRYLEGKLDEIDDMQIPQLEFIQKWFGCFISISRNQNTIVNVRQIQGVYDSFREIYQQMEQDVEDRFRQKYALIDRMDPSAIAAAQQAGVNIADDGMLVGDPDGTGFGMGVAPKSAKAEPSSVVQLKKKEREKERKKGGRDAKSPVGGKASASPSHSAKGERDVKSPYTSVEKERTEWEIPTTPISSAGASRGEKPTRPSTPPSRTAAFEEFKSERGSEINRILVENKEILSSKKKVYSDLARQINCTKVEIDNSRTKLEKLKEERETEGPAYNDEGDIIIGEDEFLEIRHLKDLKQQYKNNFAELKNLKAEVQYCQKLVDQCRQRLIQEFDNWFGDNFLSQFDEPQTSMTVGHGMRPGVSIPFNPNRMPPEDEQEKFDRLQIELLMNEPDSATFYNAQMRTQRRKTYETAMTQAQPSFNRPGVSTNKPPTMLEVSH